MSKHKYLSGGTSSNKGHLTKKKVDMPSKDQDGDGGGDSQETFNIKNKPSRSMDKKTTVQTLKDADPDATPEELAKFMKLINELMVYLSVSEDS